MSDLLLNRSIKILLLLFLVIGALYFGAPFLVPITFAMFFSFLLLPLVLWLQARGLGHGLSVFLALLLLMFVFVGVGWLVGWQLSNMMTDMQAIKDNFSLKSHQVALYINNTFGISIAKQQEFIQQKTSLLGSAISTTVASMGAILTKTIIVLVYTFLFIYYRSHFRRFLLLLMGRGDQAKAMEVTDDAGVVTQRYITGLASMIFCLWIMYGIGFSLIGIKNAVFFAILCGLLELIPYIGNLAGNLITIFGVIIQNGSNFMILEVLIVYSIVQFMQTYLLAPLIVGSVVRINPVATIAGLVAGELVWGIPGMVLVIPLLGIVKIAFDHIESLKPFGFLLGEDHPSKTPFLERVKGWFGKTKKA